MPDKVREEFHFEALCRAIADCPTGTISRPDPPDFLVTTPSHKLGIEFTTYHLPPNPGDRPHQEQQSLKDRIVALAERLHSELGGPAVYVSILFNTRPPLSKADMQPLARAIADCILKSKAPVSSRQPAIEIPSGVRPSMTAGIRVRGSVDGKDKLWQADAGGWVAKLTSQQIARAVIAKERQEAAARNRCDELWLVLVNDEASGAAPVEISEEALKAKRNSLRSADLVAASQRSCV